MKVTIIVPTRHRLRLLRYALRSAAAQDYPHDQFEVVVINDGDSETTETAVRAMWNSAVSLRYERIRHRGLSAAINRGLAVARGEYFTVLPDDDAILPNKLRVLCGHLDSNPKVDVVYSLPQYIDALGSPLPVPPQLRRFLRKHPVLTWTHILKRHGLWVHGTSTVYRTSVIEHVGNWDQKLESAEEFEFHLRLLHGGHDFHAVDAVTTVYRKHGGSKSNYYSQRRAQYRNYIYSKFTMNKKVLTPPEGKSSSPRRLPRVRMLKASHGTDGARFTGGARLIDGSGGARKKR